MEFQRGTNATLGSLFEWRQDSDKPSILLLRGRTLCTVHSVSTSRLISDIYQDSENDLHLHNLQTMLQPFDSRFRLDRVRLYYADLRDLICNRNSHPTLPSEITQLDLDAYYAFLRKNFTKPPTTLLTQLQRPRETF